MFSKAVFRFLLAVFTLTFAATMSWFLVCFFSVGSRLVLGRFDTIAVLGISAMVSATTAVPSGLLWAHYKQEGAYSTVEQIFFGVWFGLFLWMALICSISFLLAG